MQTRVIGIGVFAGLLALAGIGDAGAAKLYVSEVKLAASDATESNQFGQAVAVAGDVAMVGAPGHDQLGANSGSAYVFERGANGTNAWNQVARLYTSAPMAGDNFGYSVAVAGDVAVVGAAGRDSASGAAYVFERQVVGWDISGNGWTNAWGEVRRLTIETGVPQDSFGCSVAVAGDVVVVGASGRNAASGVASGAAYVFERHVVGWNQIGDGWTNAWGQVRELTASDGTTNDFFGHSVAVAGDVAVVGAYGDDDAGERSGSAYIFERNAGGTNDWGQVAKLTAPDAAADDRFGSAVAVDGDVVVVGSRYDDDAGNASGSAYVFERNAGGTNAWGLVRKLTASDGTNFSYFGASVAVAGDVAVVGAYGDDDAGWESGSAYVFERNAGGTNAWGQTRKLTASDGAPSDVFGVSVAVAGDMALVGAYGDDDAGSLSGSAYILPVSTQTKEFFETAKLTASEGTTNDLFGFSVAVAGDVAVIGAYGDDDADYDSGSAYVFERNAGGTNGWGRVRKLTASDGTTNDQFGVSVAVAGDVAIVGAYWDDAPGRLSGSAYVFERNAGGTNSWGEARKLTASDAAEYDQFGWSVAVAGDVVVVGALNDDDAGSSSGSAYVFERNAGGTNSWGEARKLTASDATEYDRFGDSVAVAGDVAVVGAYGDDNAGYYSGAAYVFERNAGGTNAWGQVRKLTASDASASNFFGSSVAAAGDVAVVSAPGPGDGSKTGSVYVFERNVGGTNAWGLVKKLTAPGGSTIDAFGSFVAVAADIVLVGAGSDNDMGASAGAVYVFERNAGGTNAWGQVKKLNALDGTNFDSFGISVAVAGDVVVVGAYGDDDAGDDSGSAYIFEELFPGPEAPVIERMERTGGETRLAWTSAVPADYTVQYRNQMADGAAWSNLPGAVDLPGTDALLWASNSVTVTSRFYRVQAVDSPIR